jgi:peptide/nickel transport system permease protein
MSVPINTSTPAYPVLTSSSKPRKLLGYVGISIFLFLVFIAAFAPLFNVFDAIGQNLDRVREAPSVEHWLGTDHLGRDQLARLSAALRVSLGSALVAVLVAACIGCGLGVLAAWRGGWAERAISAFADATMALPGLLLVLLVASLSPGAYVLLYLGVALTMWVEYFRVVRAMSHRVLSGSPVEAARLLGFGPLYIVRRYLLPELLPVIGTLMCFGVSTAVLAVAALGFVGVGLQPPAAELGVMLIELMPYYEEAPWLLAAPAACLLLLLVALVLLAGEKEPR